MQDRACLTQVCSTCCFSAEGTDSGFVSRDDAVRSLCFDHKPDSLLCLLEEFSGEVGGYKSEEETAEASQTSINQLGVELTIGEVAQTGTMVGPTTTELDSINELIFSEHHYYKAQEPRVCISSVHAAASDSIVDSKISNLSSPVMLNIEGIGTELVLYSTLPSAATPDPVFSRSVPATSLATTVNPSNRWNTVSSNLSSSDRAALTRMVNPNDIFTPRPIRIESEGDCNGLLHEEFLRDLELDKMLESEDMFSTLSEFLQFPSEDSAPIPQNLITRYEVSAPMVSSSPVTKCSTTTRKRKKGSTPSASPAIVNSAASPTPLVPDMSDIGFDGTLDEDVHRSPDSGCFSNKSDSSSPLCERTLSPSSDDSGSDIVGFPYDWNSDLFETFMSLASE